MEEKIKFVPKENISRIPQRTGVYFLCLKDKKPLYIGKSANLKTRIKNHCQSPNGSLERKIQDIAKIGYVTTDSEIEALILESQLIKKYKPKLNTLLKDDKNFFYVEISKEKLPRIFLTHQIKQKLKIQHIGPFTDGKSLKTALKLLRRTFPYLTEKKHPKLPCLYCHIDLCPGPAPNPKEYQKNIKHLIKILKGQKQSVIKDLEKEMKMVSKNQEFEKAAKIRDQIKSLKNIFSHKTIFEKNAIFDFPTFSSDRRKKWEKEDWKSESEVENSLSALKKLLGLEKIPYRIEGYDVSNIQGASATGSMVVFINGLPNKNLYRRFKIKFGQTPNDTAMIKEVLLRRFQHSEWPLPDLIFIDGGRAQLNAAIHSLNQHTSAKSASISVLALAKKENLLFIENQNDPIRLNSYSDSLKFTILRIRDEAHRFAISHYRKLHRRRLVASG